MISNEQKQRDRQRVKHARRKIGYVFNGFKAQRGKCEECGHVPSNLSELILWSPVMRMPRWDRTDHSFFEVGQFMAGATALCKECFGARRHD